MKRDHIKMIIRHPVDVRTGQPPQRPQSVFHKPLYPSCTLSWNTHGCGLVVLNVVWSTHSWMLHAHFNI